MKRKITNKKTSSPIIEVVFCGLIRNPDLFKKSLEQMEKFKKEKILDRIVFSTWDYEIDKYSGMREYLKKKKVFLIENKEPENRGIGNIWCQMKSLEAALKIINHESFVLKTRPDLYIDENFLKKLFENKENLLKIKYSLPGGNIFKYKVWIPYYEITSPFHMADECFFGHHNDVNMLVNFFDYIKYYNLRAGVVHINRYIHPFIDKYPEIKYFFQKDSNIGFPRDDSLNYKLLKKFLGKIKISSNFLDSLTVANRFRVLRKRLKDESYVKTLAVYYTILYSHFYIENKCVDNEFNNRAIWNRNSTPNITVDDPQIIKNFSKNRIGVKTKGQIYSGDEKLLENIFENRMPQEDRASTKILEAIDNFNH